MILNHTSLKIKDIINGIRKHVQKNRAAYSIKIGNQEYSADIRAIDDGYYDPCWAKNMINQRVIYKNQIFVPDPINAFYSLLYHALIHKNNFEDKYTNEFAILAKAIALDIDSSVFADREKSFSVLQDFMNNEGYEITRPRDFSVQYNYNYKGFKRMIWEFIGRLKNG